MKTILTLKTTTKEENWNIDRQLQEQGWERTSDCVWTRIYCKGNDRIVVTYEPNRNY